MKDWCGDEPWPCLRPDCSNSECVEHRKGHPDCEGYACSRGGSGVRKEPGADK